MSQVYKILVIDDDEEGGFNLYESLAAVSEEPKFELMWQRSGVRAIDFLKANTADLIILDQRFILSGDLTVQDFYSRDVETGEISPLPPGATSQDVEPHQGEQGFLILAKLQEEEKTRQIPVIFCTAFPEEDLGIRSIKGGASDYWPKDSLRSPGASHSIISKIKRVLDIPETLAETTEALPMARNAPTGRSGI